MSFDALPSEVRGPFLAAAQTATKAVGQHEGSLEKFEGKRLRARTVKEIEQAAAARNKSSVSPVSGTRVLNAALEEAASLGDVHDLIENIAVGKSNRSAMASLDPEQLPRVAAAANAAAARIDREKLRVWKEFRTQLEQDHPNSTGKERDAILSKMRLRESVEMSGDLAKLRDKYEELDRNYSSAVMTGLDADRRYLDHQVSEALERDDCYMGLRYAEAAYSRTDDPARSDLKLARDVADEVVKANEARVKELRSVIASFLPPRATVNSVIAKGPEAYRPETSDQDATLFSLLTAEHGARDMANQAGVASRRLDARLLGV